MIRWNSDLRETAVRQTGYSWSGLRRIARRAGYTSMRDIDTSALMTLVRAHLEGPKRPVPTSRFDALGRVQRAR
jgi:hypothetical protein